MNAHAQPQIRRSCIGDFKSPNVLSDTTRLDELVASEATLCAWSEPIAKVGDFLACQCVCWARRTPACFWRHLVMQMDGITPTWTASPRCSASKGGRPDLPPRSGGAIWTGIAHS